jgi:hypothetical protein
MLNASSVLERTCDRRSAGNMEPQADQAETSTTDDQSWSEDEEENAVSPVALDETAIMYTSNKNPQEIFMARA